MCVNINGNTKCTAFDYIPALQEVAKNEGIYDAKIVTQPAFEKGDGYIAELKILDIIGQNENLHVVVKIAPTNKKLRERGIVVDAFKNEINFYTKIYPIFQKFHDKRNIEDQFKGIPKCYKTSNEQPNEFLVLENLKMKGYSMWDRKIVMDREHVIAVFQEYAKFHALSFTLREQEPDKFEEASRSGTDIFWDYMDDPAKLQAFNDIIDKTCEKVKETFGEDKEYKAFKNLSQVWNQDFREAKDKYADFNAILHGDCWCNNLMFKNGDSETSPISIKIIDWQVLKIGPPIFDLSHFLYACGSKELFDDLDNLLEIYHEAFCKQTRALGSDGDKLLPLARLKGLWKEYGRYGLIMAILALKVTTTDSDEAPDLSKTVEEDVELISAFYFEGKNDDEYFRRLNDVIIHCCEREFI